MNDTFLWQRYKQQLQINSSSKQKKHLRVALWNLNIPIYVTSVDVKTNP